MKSKPITISNALKDAKELMRIMFYLCGSDYKVEPAQGVVMSDRLLQFPVQIAERLEGAVKYEADNEA